MITYVKTMIFTILCASRVDKSRVSF